MPSLDDDRTLRALLALVDATCAPTCSVPATAAGQPSRRDGVQARPGQGARPAAAASDVRDLGVLAPGRGRAPARRPHRPRRHPLERSPRGLPHRGARPGEGTDGEERGHRADRREGRLRPQAAAPPTPDEFRAEGRGLLPRSSSPACSTSPTTSSAGEVVPPPATVRYDGDDPYLVVAADKGTATFSDIANAISAEYGFWLGDAFASGGSAGYDHKAMGITARGAWESVRRHARGDRQGRRPRPAHRGRHRRHVRRRVRQRPAALAARASWSPRSTIGTSSSIPTPIRPRRSPSGSGCSSCRAAAGPTTTPTLLSAGGGVYPRTREEHRAVGRGAARARHRSHARSRPTELLVGHPARRRSTCCGTAASAPT